MIIESAIVPSVTSSWPAEVESGETVVIEGTHLDIVTGIRLGDNAVAIAEKTGDRLTFLAPAVTEETSWTVTLIYTNTLGSGRELVVEGSLVVKPSQEPEPERNVLVWDNVVIGDQATGQSFFNGSTGAIISPCDLFENQAVVDFMMNVSSNNENQFYNPSNATNVLKNQTCGGLVLGTEDGKSYTTFLTMNTEFRVLTTSGAQGTLRTKVQEDDIEEINYALFTGISAPSSNTPKDFVVGDVVWFYNATKNKNGLILIKEVNTKDTSAENTIKMCVYYQK